MIWKRKTLLKTNKFDLHVPVNCMPALKWTSRNCWW